MESMDRREALRTLGAFASLSLFTPDEQALAAEARRTLGWDLGHSYPRALSAHQLETVGLLADVILPATETPGATDVGVPAFIDLMVEEWLDEEESAAFLTGIEELDRTARDRFGATFAGAEPADRVTLVEELDQSLTTPVDPDAGPDFYRWMKRLTLTGYFTSEEGAALTGYRIVPGAFEGCSVSGGSR
jgi:hypothetical protein